MAKVSTIFFWLTIVLIPIAHNKMCAMAKFLQKPQEFHKEILNYAQHKNDAANKQAVHNNFPQKISSSLGVFELREIKDIKNGKKKIGYAFFKKAEKSFYHISQSDYWIWVSIDPNYFLEQHLKDFNRNCITKIVIKTNEANFSGDAYWINNSARIMYKNKFTEKLTPNNQQIERSTLKGGFFDYNVDYLPIPYKILYTEKTITNTTSFDKDQEKLFSELKDNTIAAFFPVKIQQNVQNRMLTEK